MCARAHTTGDHLCKPVHIRQLIGWGTMQNRDMVAFTVGLVALSLMRDGRPVSDAAILDRLNEIADGGVGNRITPFMAESALYALRALDARAAVIS